MCMHVHLHACMWPATPARPPACAAQVSVLAESLGLQVRYYDHVPKLALGNAQAVDSLDALLRCADFVSLHVPLTQVRTRGEASLRASVRGEARRGEASV